MKIVLTGHLLLFDENKVHLSLKLNACSWLIKKRSLKITYPIIPLYYIFSLLKAKSQRFKYIATTNQNNKSNFITTKQLVNRDEKSRWELKCGRFTHAPSLPSCFRINIPLRNHGEFFLVTFINPPMLKIYHDIFLKFLDILDVVASYAHGTPWLKTR